MTNIGIFASGSKDGGGSGARKLLERVESGDINGVQNITIVSNHPQGGPYQIVEDMKARLQALNIGLEFHHVGNFPTRGKDGTFSAEDLKAIRDIGTSIMKQYGLDYIFLSGWIKHVIGLPPQKVVNIHPGPTQEPYGGVGMYGHYVHEKVLQDYQAGRIKRSCVTMHYVTDEVDRGPVICQIPVELDDCESADDVGRKVNKVEHEWQWKITKMIINGEIYLDDSGIVHYPENFPYQGEIDITATN